MRGYQEFIQLSGAYATRQAKLRKGKKNRATDQVKWTEKGGNTGATQGKAVGGIEG